MSIGPVSVSILSPSTWVACTESNKLEKGRREKMGKNFLGGIYSSRRNLVTGKSSRVKSAEDLQMI